MLNLRKLLGIEKQQQKRVERIAKPLHQYAQYMNADGSGGGFGPTNPSALKVKPNYGLQNGQNPVDMDTVPGNAQFGQHPAYYQGSNPFQNMPTRNVYNNISPMPVDEMQYGRQIQPGYTNRFNFWN